MQTVPLRPPQVEFMQRTQVQAQHARPASCTLSAGCLKQQIPHVKLVFFKATPAVMVGQERWESAQPMSHRGPSEPVQAGRATEWSDGVHWCAQEALSRVMQQRTGCLQRHVIPAGSPARCAP